MNVTAPKSNAYLPFATNTKGEFDKFADPFIAETFNNLDLDIDERLKKYYNHDVLSTLSGSDEIGEIFLLTAVSDSPIFR